MSRRRCLCQWSRRLQRRSRTLRRQGQRQRQTTQRLLSSARPSRSSSFKQPEATLVALRNDAVMTAQVVAPPVDALQLIQQILDVKRCGAALEKKAAAKALRDHLDPLTPADHAVCQFCECQPTFKLHESVEFTLN